LHGWLTPYNDYILAPAYDLISTSVHFPDEARTALDLFENYESDSFRANGFYEKIDFLKLAEFLGLKKNRAASFIGRFFTGYEKPWNWSTAHSSVMKQKSGFWYYWMIG
jgi:serine/threonine-protein kinase HipA